MYARTVGKKVRASAAASADELDGDVPSVGIGKALSVILILHVLAIAAIYIGTQWEGDDKSGQSNAIVVDDDTNDEEQIAEPINDNPGTVYLDTPASYDLSNESQGARTGDEMNDRPGTDQGLTVEPQKRRPRVIKPRRDPNKPKPMTDAANVSYVEYKIQKGDNFYRLAKKYKVNMFKIDNV